jgi:hypothetical protein
VRIAWRRVLPFVLLAASVGMGAEPLPDPPCDGDEPYPPYAPAIEARPVTWGGLDWHPPACLAWPAGKYRFVIAIAAILQVRDEAELLTRLGAVSSTVGMRYWSVTESAWRVLIRDASALTQVDGERRPDFAPSEMRTGAVLYFVEEDNRSSAPVTYRMRVVEAGPGRILVETENVTPIKAALITFFPPGALRTAYFMTRLADGRWGFYGLSAATHEASGLVALAKDSYVNRAEALFAHFAGLPQENGVVPAR